MNDNRQQSSPSQDLQVVRNQLTEYSATAPLSARSLIEQAKLIEEVVDQVMVDGVHYGHIPGTPKDSRALLQPGAEKLLSVFRIAPSIHVEDLSEPGERRYRVTVSGAHMGTGTFVGQGVGTCSTMEGKYRWRKAVNRQEWEAAPEDQRRIKHGNGDNGPYTIQQVRQDPGDMDHTVMSMAIKRALVAMTKTLTACSDRWAPPPKDDNNQRRERHNGRTKPQQQAPAQNRQPPPQQARNNAPPPDAYEDDPRARAQPAPRAAANSHTTTGQGTAKRMSPSPEALRIIKLRCEDHNIMVGEVLAHFGVERLEELDYMQANEALTWIKNNGVKK